MKKSRFTEEQIIGVLKQHEAGIKTGGFMPGARESTRRRSMVGQSKYGGMEVNEAQRFEAMEDGNRRLSIWLRT